MLHQTCCCKHSLCACACVYVCVYVCVVTSLLGSDHSCSTVPGPSLNCQHQFPQSYTISTYHFESDACVQVHVHITELNQFNIPQTSLTQKRNYYYQIKEINCSCRLSLSMLTMCSIIYTAIQEIFASQ